MIKKGKHVYKCLFKDCNKIYFLKNKILTHLRTHYGVKPFKCSICSKSFNEKGNLKTHLRVHTGERPYKCKECHKGFKALGQLKDHIISHTVYKPFQCPYCLKFYRRKGILKNHMLIHLKDPSYSKSIKYYEEIYNNINVVSPINRNLIKKYMIHLKKKETVCKCLPAQVKYDKNTEKKVIKNLIFKIEHKKKDNCKEKFDKSFNDDDNDFSEQNENNFICLNDFSGINNNCTKLYYINYFEDRINNNNDTYYNSYFIKLMQNKIDDDFLLKNEMIIYNKKEKEKEKENENLSLIPVFKNDLNENSNNLCLSKNEEKNIDFINDECECEESLLI